MKSFGLNNSNCQFRPLGGAVGFVIVEQERWHSFKMYIGLDFKLTLI